MAAHALSTMNEMYLTRSATAPDTIVAAVPANTNWKKNLAHNGTQVQLIAPYTPSYLSVENEFDDAYASPRAGELSAPLTNHKPSVPTYGVIAGVPPAPNIKPQPMTQNEIVDAANTIKFLARMLAQFFARHSPLSTRAKPAFIQNTSIAVTSTHTVSNPTLNAEALVFRVSTDFATSAAGLAP